MTAENRGCRGRVFVFRTGFNEAAANDRGKYGGVRGAPDGRRRFNEAAANDRGKCCRRRSGCGRRRRLQ